MIETFQNVVNIHRADSENIVESFGESLHRLKNDVDSVLDRTEEKFSSRRLSDKVHDPVHFGSGIHKLIPQINQRSKLLIGSTDSSQLLVG